MRKDGTALVEEIVDAKFDAAFDDPPQGPVMVVNDVVHQKRVVESAVSRWVERGYEVRTRYVYVLERVPYLREGQGVTLIDEGERKKVNDARCECDRSRPSHPGLRWTDSRGSTGGKTLLGG